MFIDKINITTALFVTALLLDILFLSTLQATSGPELEKTNNLTDGNHFKKNLSNGNIPETLNERMHVASEGNIIGEIMFI